jgi:lysophospholipase L1-like esterase
VGRFTTFVVTFAVAFSTVGQPSGPTRPHQMTSAGSPANHVAVIGDSYTAGTDEGGEGPNAWTAQAWTTLAHQGTHVIPDVAAEGGAGYVARGNRGSTFGDLTAAAVHPDDVLVVFFGSRNDQGAPPGLLAAAAHDAFDFAHRTAPSARLLVIGPPWPTADPPDAVLQVRDLVAGQAQAAGATFIDPIAENWFVGQPDLIGADGVHPNDAGHSYMAAKIVPLIRAQLPRRA